MTSKIKVDNINKVSDDSNIIKKCGTTVTVGDASDGVRTGANNLQASDGGNLISQSGTTITLGASGDTITLASGANQSGFGRSGSVNWQTTPKTATFTAADGEGYFINSGSALTMNLPAGSAGAIVAVSDYARNFATNNLTISPNGSEKIGGVADDLILNVNGQASTLVYVDATKGWINVQNAEDTQTGQPPFICASVSGAGNTLATAPDCANAKIATFTGPGSFTVNSVSVTPANNAVAYMIVGAGGGGGGGGCGGDAGGGGGAGGFREGVTQAITPYTASPLVASTTSGITVSAQAYPIQIGGGGPGGSGPGNGTPGNVVSALGLTSTGGGFGKGNTGAPHPAGPGGSGGGGRGGGGIPAIGGDGNTPTVNPPQGRSGGAGGSPTGPNPQSPDNASGGGGGATAVGENASGGASGGGGTGATTSISASPVAYAGGGGGAGFPGGSGGTGGGGAGTNLPSTGTGTNGTDNTGGGAGGGKNGGVGGSGIVIIRYKFQ